MNAALKIMERQAEALYQELKLASEDGHISDAVYVLLKQTSIVMIDIKRNIEKARAQLITKG